MITSAKSAKTGSMILYTTSNGLINICDYRERSTFHFQPSLQFVSNYKQALTSRPNIFDKQLASVKSAAFVPTLSSADPHLIVSRDYLNVKLWDLRMATGNSTQDYILNETRAGRPIYSA